MIKTELKFILPTTTPIGNAPVVVGTGVVGNYTNVANPDFGYYTNGWEASSIGTSAVIYPDLYNNDTLQAIPEFTGWNWHNGYMYTDEGSSAKLWQTLSGYTIGEYYQVQFTVKDMLNGCGITPYLFGNAGTQVTADGTYTQYIQVASVGTTYNGGIMFLPTATGTGGVSRVKVIPTSNIYRKVDLYDDENFTLTFQIQSNMSNKSATYSKTIKLPGTQNNNIIFNQLFDESLFIEFNQTNTQVSEVFLNKKIRAGIYQESIELLTGNFELQKVLNTDGKLEYEGVFYTNIKNIADAIGDVMITGNDDSVNDDIDMSQYNHIFNSPNIASTWDGVGYSTSTGIYYPLIDFSNVDSGNECRMENFRPSIYVKELWDRIFQRAGYTYTSTFLNSTLFKSLIIPMGNTRRQSSYVYENTHFDIGMNTEMDFTKTFTTGSTFGWTTQSTVINFNKTDAIYENPLNIFNTTIHKWTLTGDTGFYDLASSIRMGFKYHTTNGAKWYGQNSSGSQYSKIKVKLEIYKKSVMNGQTEIIATSTTDAVTPYKAGCWDSDVWYIPEDSFQADVYIEGTPLFKGDQLWVQITCYSTSFLPYQCGYSSIQPGYLTMRVNNYNNLSEPSSHFEMKPKDEYNSYFRILETVYANDCLPEMKQLEFISSICNKFCLMFAEDKENYNNLIIEPYDTFYYSGGTTYLNWGSKIDLSKEKWIERIPQLIDKDLQFKMNKDSNDISLKRYSESNNAEFGECLIKNPYYSDSTEKIEDKFSSTMLENFGDTDKIVSKIYGNLKSNEYNGYPTDCDYSPRILYRKYLTTSHVTPINVIYDDIYGQGLTGITLYVFSDKYPYAGIYDDPYNPTLDLNYGPAKYYDTNYNTSNNLSWTYWRNKVSQYMNPNSKMVTTWLRLTPTDISQLDFRKKILLYNKLYRLNRIIEWSPLGNSCKVELYQDAALDTNSYITPSVWKSGTVPIRPKANNINAIKGTVSLDGIILQPPKPVTWLFYSGETITDSSLLTTYTPVNETNHVLPKSASLIIGTTNKSYAKAGIIIGSDNSVSSDIYFIKGHYNVISLNSEDATIIGSNENVVTAKNVTIIGSDWNNVNIDYTLIVGGGNNNLDPPPIPDTGSTSGTTTGGSGTGVGDSIILINSQWNYIPSGYTSNVLINTSGITLSDSGKTYINNRDVDTLTDVTYVDSKATDTYYQSTGDTVTYVNNNFYDSSQSDSKYSTKSGDFSNYIKTTQTYKSNGEYLIADNWVGSTGRTITLATADKVNGKVMIIHDLAGNANTYNITIYPEGIGSPIKTMTNNNQLVIIYSDGVNWYSN